MLAPPVPLVGVYPSSSDEVDMRMDTSEDGTGSNTTLTTTERFKSTTKKLLEIGCRRAHMILHDPEPFYFSFNLEASDLPIREKKPEHFQILDSHCVDAFGPNHRAMSFKYDRLSPKDVFCELTISLPDERRCSYKTTSPRTDEKWAQQAVCKIALENGVLDFIKSADIPEGSDVCGGLVIERVTKNQVLPVDTNAMEGDLYDIRQAAQEKKLELNWIATKKPSTPIEEFGCILHIRLSGWYQATWSVPHDCEQPLEAQRKLATRYKDEILSYIKDSSRLRALVRESSTQTPLRTISAVPDNSTPKEGIPKELPVTLDTFFSELGSVPHDLEVGGKTQARQPISWLHAQTQAVKGAKQPDFHFTWSQGKYHGCLLRLEAPSALPRSYLVDAMFTKKQDAKTAVCLLAAKEHCEDYLKQTEPKRFDVLENSSIKPPLNGAYPPSKKENIRPGQNHYPEHPYESSNMKDVLSSHPPNLQSTLPLLRFSVSQDGSINQSQIPTTSYCSNQRYNALPNGPNRAPLPNGRYSGSQNSVPPNAGHHGSGPDRNASGAPITSLVGDQIAKQRRAHTVDSSDSSDPGSTICGDPAERNNDKPGLEKDRYDPGEQPYPNHNKKPSNGESGGWGYRGGRHPGNRRDDLRGAGLPPRPPPPHEPRLPNGIAGQKRSLDSQNAQNHPPKRPRTSLPSPQPPQPPPRPPFLMPQHDPERIRNITKLFKFCREAHARASRPPSTHQGSALPQFHHLDHGTNSKSNYEVWIEYKEKNYKYPGHKFEDCWDGWDQLSRKILDYLSPGYAD